MERDSRTVERILQPFLEELLPEGGIDTEKSRWQRSGRGSAIAPGRPDLRYMRTLVDVLYRLSSITGSSRYRALADSQVRFMARVTHEKHQSWLMGTTLECIGLYHRYNPPDLELQDAALRIVNWARRRRVTIRIGDLSFGHFPCGYGLLQAKDAGWTNDLSILGSGLMWVYEATRDESVLEDATGFAEYFVQPWRPNALGDDGYWHAGTWRDDLGSWVIGPYHYSGFESTDLHGDEASWIFSTYTCIDYLTHLHAHRPDPRLLDRCLRAAAWAFEKCQFDDGAVGMCGRDDKWLGTTGCAVSQFLALQKAAPHHPALPPLLQNAKRSDRYLCEQLPQASLDDHGVQWGSRTTLPDPLVNVGWMWLSALLGWLDGAELDAGR